MTRREKEAVCAPSSGRAFRFAISRSVRLRVGMKPTRHSSSASALRCIWR